MAIRAADASFEKDSKGSNWVSRRKCEVSGCSKAAGYFLGTRGKIEVQSAQAIALWSALIFL